MTMSSIDEAYSTLQRQGRQTPALAVLRHSKVIRLVVMNATRMKVETEGVLLYTVPHGQLQPFSL